MEIIMSPDFLSKPTFISLSNAALSILVVALSFVVVRVVSGTFGLQIAALLSEGVATVLARSFFFPSHLALKKLSERLVLVGICLILSLFRYFHIFVPLLVQDIASINNQSDVVQHDIVWRSINTKTQLENWLKQAYSSPSQCYSSQNWYFDADSGANEKFTGSLQKNPPVCFAATFKGLNDKFSAYQRLMKVGLESINFGSEITSELKKLRNEALLSNKSGLKCWNVLDTYISICALLGGSTSTVYTVDNYGLAEPWYLLNDSYVTWAGKSGVSFGSSNGYRIENLGTQIYINSTLQFESVLAGISEIVANYTILDNKCSLTDEILFNNMTNVSSSSLRYTVTSTVRCGKLSGYIDTYWIPHRDAICQVCSNKPTTGWIVQSNGIVVAKLGGINVLRAKVSSKNITGGDCYRVHNGSQNDPKIQYELVLKGCQDLDFPVFSNTFVGGMCAGPILSGISNVNCYIDGDFTLQLGHYKVTYVVYMLLAMTIFTVMCFGGAFGYLSFSAFRFLGNSSTFIAYSLSRKLKKDDNKNLDRGPLISQFPLYASVLIPKIRSDEVHSNCHITVAHQKYANGKDDDETLLSNENHETLLITSPSMRKIRWKNIN